MSTSQCEPITLTFDQAKAELEAIVEADPNKVYEVPVDSGTCVYFHAGEPSCIVGHLLDKHGLRIDETDTRNENSVLQLIDDGLIKVDSKSTRSLLFQVQQLQDDGREWRTALHFALEEVEEERRANPDHVNYPHQEGYLDTCPACQESCHCTEGSAECIYEGEHNGSAS